MMINDLRKNVLDGAFAHTICFSTGRSYHYLMLAYVVLYC